MLSVEERLKAVRNARLQLEAAIAPASERTGFLDGFLEAARALLYAAEAQLEEARTARAWRERQNQRVRSRPGRQGS